MYRLVKLKEEKVFKDPIHGYIHINDQLIWDLINTPEFQRLRRIRQLGMTYFTFHGAEHSRFNHSLGVYELMRRVLSHFRRNYALELQDDEVALGLCAALLHDVGHAPFSHSMEHALHMKHEIWSRKIIESSNGISTILNAFKPGFAKEVSSVIANEHPNKLIESLISSQLDVDRMDYLLRDAYYTGVNYGNFDLERVLRIMRPHPKLESIKNDPNTPKVVLKFSGWHAVEDFIVSRYQMFWQIYFHPVTRSAEVLLGKIFKRAQDLARSNYTFSFMLEPLDDLIMNNVITVEQYLRMDESFMQTVFYQWMDEKDVVLSDLCRRLINRDLFKYQVLPADEKESKRICIEMEQLLRQKGFDPEYYMETDYPKDTAYHVYEVNGPLIKTPIAAIDNQDHLIEISNLSVIVKSLGEKKSVGATNLYVPELKNNEVYER